MAALAVLATAIVLTYLVLGMTPGHVSRIVLYETVLVGLLSLAVGLICGVLLSQGLSFFTAALFFARRR